MRVILIVYLQIHAFDGRLVFGVCNCAVSNVMYEYICFTFMVLVKKGLVSTDGQELKVKFRMKKLTKKCQLYKTDIFRLGLPQWFVRFFKYLYASQN